MKRILSVFLVILTVFSVFTLGVSGKSDSVEINISVEGAGKEAIIRHARIYCSAIEEAGCEAGIYASLEWWNNILDDPSLDEYHKWVAQWNYRCTYDGEYMMWQCASDGKVDGIEGNVDINFEISAEEKILKTVETVIPMRLRMLSGPYGKESMIRAGTEFDIVKIRGKWGKTTEGYWIDLGHTNEID